MSAATWSHCFPRTCYYLKHVHPSGGEDDQLIEAVVGQVAIPEAVNGVCKAPIPDQLILTTCVGGRYGHLKYSCMYCMDTGKVSIPSGSSWYTSTSCVHGNH